HQVGAELADVVYQQSAESGHLDGVAVEGLEEVGPFVCGEHRQLRRVVDDGDDHPIEHGPCPVDQVHVPARRRVEAPGAQCGSHSLTFSYLKILVSPYRLSAALTQVSGGSGST